MLTAFVPAQRHFTVTVVRDYEDRVTVLPISEDVYITGKLKYSIVSRRLNPEWVQELKRIAFKIMDNLSGTTILSIQVKMGITVFSTWMGLTNYHSCSNNSAAPS